MARSIAKKIVWWLCLPFWWPLALIALIDWAAGGDEEEVAGPPLNQESK
jgi:hypothetical protein